MAKSIPLTRQLFWIPMATLAIAFLGLIGFTLAQIQMGKLKPEDLRQFLFVLRGDKRYLIRADELEELEDLRKKVEQFEADAREREGGAPIRQTAAEAARRNEEIQQKNYGLLKDLLERQKAEVLSLIEEKNALKAELETLRETHNDAIITNQDVDRAARTQELVNTLQNMDAADVGQFIDWYIKNETGGVIQAVDYMLRYMKPDFRAEVLTEMPVQTRQQILPLLANKNAGLTPPMVLRRWRAEKVDDAKIRAHEIMLMSAEQAFAVFYLLDPTDRAKLAPYLRMQSQP